MKFLHTKHREKRIKKKFLFFPKRISGETRWFEYAEWEEEYYDALTAGWWEPTRWIN